MLRRIAISVLGLLLSATAAAQDVIWQQAYQGGSPAANTTMFHSARIGDDIVAGGRVGSSVSAQNYLLYRIRGSDGTIVWSRILDSGAGSDDVNDIVVDPATNAIYFCGRANTAGQALNWYVMKLNGADGSNAWPAPYTADGGSNQNDEPFGIALIDDAGTTNVIVAGQILTSTTNSGRAVKLSGSNGSLLWTFNYPDSARFMSYGNVFVQGSHIYLVGRDDADTPTSYGVVTKLNSSTGAHFWNVRSRNGTTSGGHNFGNGVIDAASGDFIASGFAQSGNPSNDNDIAIARFRASDGTRLWQTLIGGAGNVSDTGNAIVADSTHVYIGTGSYRPTTSGSDWFLARINLSNGLYDAGNGGWTKTYAGDAVSQTEQLSNLKLASGVLYAAGRLQYLTPGAALTTVKLTASTGAEINRTTFLDRIGASFSGFEGMQVMSNGDLVTTGASNVSTNFVEFGRYGQVGGAADANLSNLTVSAGTLSPAFSSGLQQYTATVGNGVASVNITPTVAQAGSTVRINGTAVASGSPYAAAVAVGLNDFNIVVTASDNATTKTYVLVITRDVCATCPVPWQSLEAVGSVDTPESSLTRSTSDQIYGIWRKGFGATGEYKLRRYDNPGSSATWTSIGSFLRSDVPNFDSVSSGLSMVIDSTGRFHVVFRGTRGTGLGNARGVWYGTSATGASGSWTFTEILTVSDPNGAKNTDDVRIRVDPNNRPRIVFVTSDANTGVRDNRLKHYAFNGSSWVATELQAAVSDNEINTVDFDIDSAGVSHVAFMLETTLNDGNLMYVNNSSGSFPAATALVTGSANQPQAETISIVRDASDNLHLVRSNYLDELYYHRRTGTTWAAGVRINSNLAGTVQADSLSMNGLGDLYLVYRELTRNELRYAYLPSASGSTWLTGLLYRGNTATASLYSGAVSNYRYGFAWFDHRPGGPSGSQELWAAVQVLPAPEIALEQPAPTAVADGGSRSFGNVNLSTFADLVFTIRNTGNAPLTLSAPTFDGTHAGDYAVQSAPASLVSAGGSTTMTIRFTPSATGTRSAALHLANGDSDENPYDVSLSGVGVNTPPSITVVTGLSRQQGTAASVSGIATVGDTETGAASVVVTAPSLPSGITLGSITNSAGTITANLGAACSAATGNTNIGLVARDPANATSNATLVLNVTANSAPTLAYVDQNAVPGASLNVSPTTALSDNGSIASVVVQSVGSFTGTISVNSAGVVSLGTVAPSGNHTLVIRATDNCGAVTDASFVIRVNAAPTITAAAITVQQGSPIANRSLATVADIETAASGLILDNPANSTGLAVTALSNAAGAVTADLVASCSATQPGLIRLGVTDGAGLRTQSDLAVTVQANAAPVAPGYANQTVLPAGTVLITPSSAASDNGSVTLSVQSPGSFTGSISVDAAGVVSVGNAQPAGAHTIVIAATDNCGVVRTSSFELLVNAPPSLSPNTGLSRQQGSTATSSMIATAGDGETGAGSVVVSAISVPSGISIDTFSNAAGTVSARIAAACDASVGSNSIGLRARDPSNAQVDGNLQLDVTPNTPPVLAYDDQASEPGGSVLVVPTSFLDNGSITGVAVIGVGSFTGSISANASGELSLAAIAPSGDHTITVRATDNCGSTFDASFLLRVNARPQITAAIGLSVRQGSPAAVLALASVNDAETAAAALLVSNPVNSSGLIANGLSNNAGAVSASVAASCSATDPGFVRLGVSDAANASATVDVPVSVLPNTPPTFGVYSDHIVAPGAAATVSPDAVPADNGTTSASVLDASGFTGTISVDSNGVISVSNAQPAGAHIITVRITDNCGSSVDRSFELLINTPPQITPQTISLRQGSPASLKTLAQVSDGESAASALTVSLESATVGLSVDAPSNESGAVTAMVAASCTAADGSIALSVSDGRQLGAASTPVTVLANTPPELAYADTSIGLGESTKWLPSTSLGDNGSISELVITSAGGFTGTLSLDSQGRISIANAQPPGTFTISLRATDNCGAETTPSFALSVARRTPELSLTPSVSLARFGQDVTLTASVRGLDPSGNVTFWRDSQLLGTVPLAGTGDEKSASLVVSGAAVGVAAWRAEYAGDSNNQTGNATASGEVIAAATRIAVAPDANPGAPGLRSIQVQVSALAPGSGVAQGQVLITSGSSQCTAVLASGSGACNLNLAVGYRGVSATYLPGNGNHLASSGSTALVIADASTVADVRVRVGNGQSYVVPGSTVHYQITVDNLGPGPAVAQISAPLAAGLTAPSFQCLRAGPALCEQSQGSGAIAQTLSLGAGGVVVFTLETQADLAPEIEVVQGAAAVVLAPVTDPDLSNNAASDRDPMALFADSIESEQVDE